MSRHNVIALLIGMIVAVTVITVHVMKHNAEKTTYKAEMMEPIKIRNMGIYEKYFKRLFDIICAMSAIVCFSPLYIGVAALVRLKLGSPVLFTQDRPGLLDKDGKETIFKMYKFRTMTDEKNPDTQELLPDEVRLTKFGAWLRSTSLDELPEAFNILNGTMSIVGPRPQLVRDMVFMNNEQRKRHTAKPGLSGLAQVNGRNTISWEEKLKWDQEYIKHISCRGDIAIILKTIKTAIIKKEGITEENMATADDYGDYLLKTKRIDFNTYEQSQERAKKILNNKKNVDDEMRIEAVKKSAKYMKYSVLMSLYKREKPEYLRLAIDSMLNQTVAPDEIIIVEDGPLTEDLYKVLEEYPMIHRVKNERNLGLGLALNVGLKVCRNELIARMDTDDYSKSERCEKQLARFAEKPYLAIVGAHVDEFVGNLSNVVSQRKVPITSEEIYDFAKKRSAFNHPVVMYSKTAVLENGGYADLKRNQDVDLFGRMLFQGYQAENIDESLLWFRSSYDLAKRRKSWENTWSYIATIKKFWQMGYSTLGDYLLVAVAQTGMYFMPVRIQNYVYKRFLRK